MKPGILVDFGFSRPEPNPTLNFIQVMKARAKPESEQALLKLEFHLGQDLVGLDLASPKPLSLCLAVSTHPRK